MKWTKGMYLMAGLSGVSVVCAVASYIQHKRTASLLKKTVKELAEATPVEIEKEVVDEVVQEALEMKVDSQVDDILEETKEEIRKKIGSTVTTAVAAEIGRCHDQTAKAYSEKIAQITVDDVKDELIKKSAQLVEKKIDGQMDDILKQYQKRLDSINDMYVRMMQKTPNLTLASNVNPGIHVNW